LHDVIHGSHGADSYLAHESLPCCHIQNAIRPRQPLQADYRGGSAPQSDSIRKELIRRRKIGESIILDRLKRAKAEGDLPPDADPADLARYLSIVIYGITIQAAGGATRKELRSAAALALRSWAQAPNAKGKQDY
jgi:hypothetical protein